MTPHDPPVRLSEVLRRLKVESDSALLGREYRRSNQFDFAARWLAAQDWSAPEEEATRPPVLRCGGCNALVEDCRCAPASPVGEDEGLRSKLLGYAAAIEDEGTIEANAPFFIREAAARLPVPAEAETDAHKEPLPGVPRRAQLEHLVPAEHAIRQAVYAVEEMPADERLTRAVILLGEASNLVADFVDGVEGPPAPSEGGGE